MPPLSAKLYAKKGVNAYKISKIQVDGLKRTKRSTVVNELEFVPGDTVSKRQIVQALTNVRNTELFGEVRFKLSGDRNQTTLTIIIQERWTTIPIIKFSSGGGVSQTAFGVFDPNVLGRSLELGGQYERLAGTNSGVAWIRKNRIGSTPYGLDIQYWLSNRIRTKYDQQAEEAVPTNGFLQKRSKLYLGVSRRLPFQLKALVSYEFNGDTFSDDVLSEEVQEQVPNVVLPPETKVHFVGFGLSYGEIKTKNLNLSGFSLFGNVRHGFVSNEADYETTIPQTAAMENFWEANLQLLYYHSLPFNLTFAQRAAGGGTSTNIEQYLFYVGGLDRIRGFSDNRFFGRYYWLSNTELRWVALQKKWVALQPTVFLDVVSNVNHISDLFGVTAASGGAGLRVILPHLYRFVIRFDYAKTLKKADTGDFSFGGQQFF
jgi:hypothetical protein